MIHRQRLARISAVAPLLALTLTGCGDARQDDARTTRLEGQPTAAPEEALGTGEEQLVAPLSPVGASQGWTVEQSAGGARLVYDPLDPADDTSLDPVLVLTCTGGGHLIVRLPRVAAIGSEERLSIGSGDNVVALVADTTPERGGIAARGEVPNRLGAMLGAGFAVSYGAYSTGVLPPVPPASIDAIRSSCN
ncbi:hypothetical protein [Sphingomicrobium arenosum]|uniref:hypothetical protein n=1 Tax=Sphingomicrobium arenosum TaxID=2233861 RepID=UPI002240EECC|nr:hypothetical protein [Sphingomicrobium arenosum]